MAAEIFKENALGLQTCRFEGVADYGKLTIML